LNAISEVSTDPEIKQTRQEYEDVPGAIKQSWPIRQAMEVIVNLIHVLARQQERYDHTRAEYEVEFLHA
jgi:hypothetical protein